MHLNPGEEVRYAFACQKYFPTFDFITTCVVAVTNKRLLIGTKKGFYLGIFITQLHLIYIMICR